MINQGVDKTLPKKRNRKPKTDTDSGKSKPKRVRKPKNPNVAVENAAKPKRKWERKSAASKIFSDLSIEFDKGFNGPQSSGESDENLFHTVNNFIIRQIEEDSKNNISNVCVEEGEILPVDDTNEDPSTSSLRAKRHSADTFYITQGKPKKLRGELLDYVMHMYEQK